MSVISAQLMTLWQNVLKLSQVQPGESVVVLNTCDGSTPYKSVAISQSEILGAQVSYVEVSSRYALPDAVLPLLNAADLIIDLAFILDGRIHRCRETGTRVLVILEPPEILERMLPRAEDKLRVVDAKINWPRQRLCMSPQLPEQTSMLPWGSFRPWASTALPTSQATGINGLGYLSSPFPMRREPAEPLF